MRIVFLFGIYVSFLQLNTAQELLEERNDILEWYYNLNKQDFVSNIPRDKRQSLRFVNNKFDDDNDDSDEWYVFDEVEAEPPEPHQTNQGQFSWNPNDIPSSTSRPQFPNAGPPRPSRCVENCNARTTSEYNPVCGNNGQTFNNRAKLNCANFCGINVQFRREGRCSPLLP